MTVIFIEAFITRIVSISLKMVNIVLLLEQKALWLCQPKQNPLPFTTWLPMG